MRALLLWNNQKKLPKLLTSAEIVSMAMTEWYPRTNTIAELNTHPKKYYWQLVNDFQITTQNIQDWRKYNTNYNPCVLKTPNASATVSNIIYYKMSSTLKYFLTYMDNVWKIVQMWMMIAQ